MTEPTVVIDFPSDMPRESVDRLIALINRAWNERDAALAERDEAQGKAGGALVALDLTAEEVKELRAELAEHRRALAAAQQAIRELPVITDEMEAEVARLTEALKRLMDPVYPQGVIEVARAALSPGKVPDPDHRQKGNA